VVESLSSDDDDNELARGPLALSALVVALALSILSRLDVGSFEANPMVID